MRGPACRLGGRDIAMTSTGIIMKLFSLLVGAIGVVVVTGFPVYASPRPALLMAWHAATHVLAPAPGVATVVDAGVQWTECGSLVLLATGMFGASLIIGRQRGRRP